MSNKGNVPDRPYTIILLAIATLAAATLIISGILAAVLSDSVWGVIAGCMGVAVGAELIVIMARALGE